jgi:hypothetical protein
VVLCDERGRRIYEINRQYDVDGTALHDPVTGFGFCYLVIDLATGEEIGTDTYLGCAKAIAERHFAKLHGGKLTGYWTSDRLTLELGHHLAAECLR